ncbi:hypothetical protein [Peribacillus simplex]|uniref:hypothetical protein n=1 Tax=Peribacillus simplex TaxID=1478 RepID=UPI0033382A81
MENDFNRILTNQFFVFPVKTLTKLKKFTTLLPDNRLAKITLDACIDEAWQTVGGKGTND